MISVFTRPVDLLNPRHETHESTLDVVTVKKLKEKKKMVSLETLVKRINVNVVSARAATSSRSP